MVTFWGVFQLAGVKVNAASETVPSAVLPLATAMLTSSRGALPSLTLKLAVWPAPAASVTVAVVGVTTTPALSSSTVVRFNTTAPSAA